MVGPPHLGLGERLARVCQTAIHSRLSGIKRLTTPTTNSAAPSAPTSTRPRRRSTQRSRGRSRCRAGCDQRLTDSCGDGNSHRKRGVLRALREESANRLRRETSSTRHVSLRHSALLTGCVEGANDPVDGVNPAALAGVALRELGILHPAIEVSVELSPHAPLRV